MPFVNELRDLGYVEGRNLVLERRYAAGDTVRLENFAIELAALKLDLIVAFSTPAVQAAQRATATIPVVFAVVVDPIGAGLVASLARPERNLTGVSLLSAELSGKRLELLQDFVPRLARVAVLRNPLNDSNALQVRQLESAARARGVQLKFVDVQAASDVDQALDAAIRARAGALIALDDQVIASQGARIAAVARSHRLPSASGIGSLAEAGFLISYGPSLPDHFRRVAGYADRILKGAKPADLPVEQPAEFELVINMKTARAMGLAVPRSVLLRATQIIH